MSLRQRHKLTGSPLSSRVAQWTQTGFIKSIQVGTVTIPNASATATAAVTAVAIANSLLIWNGQTSDDTSGLTTDTLGRITLTNATTITGTRTGTGTGSGSFCAPKFTLIEFQPGVLKSVQYGVVTLAGVVSATATITTVNTLKSAVFGLGVSTSGGYTSGEISELNLTLTNATTVTAAHVLNSLTIVYGFVVPEFYS